MRVNVSTNIICLLIMLSLSSTISRHKNRGNLGRLYYIIALVTLFELFIEILASVKFESRWFFEQVVLTLYFGTMPLLGVLWAIYIYMLVSSSPSDKQRAVVPCLMIPYYLYVLLCLSNPYTHYFFTLDKDMVLTRNAAYIYFGIIMYSVLSLMSLFFVIKNYRTIKPKSIIGIIFLYYLLIAAAIWAQTSIDGCLVINATFTAIFVITYFTIQGRRVSILSKNLIQMEESKKEALKRALAEERFRLVARDSNDIVFEINLAKKTAVANDNYYKILGNEVEFDYEWERKTVHPDDLERLRQVKHRLLNAEKGVSLELRLKTKDGAYKWFMLTISSFADDSGYITRVMGKYSDIDRQVKERELLKHRAQMDFATGLYNKSATEELISLALESGDMAPSAVLIADIDDLKIINDSFGHTEGDRAISMVAGTLKAHFRSTDIIGRIGGDEFMVLLSGMGEENKIRATLTALSHKIFSLHIGRNNDYPIRCSMGLVIARPGDSFEELYRKADKAMYFVKRDTKNAYAVYTPEMENSEYEYEDAEASIRDAIMFDMEETALLMYSLAVFFPFIASANLVENSYNMLEYSSYGIDFGPEIGIADDLFMSLIEKAYDEDREACREMLDRDFMAESFSRGERVLTQIIRQQKSESDFCWAKIVVILTEDEHDQLCSVILMRTLSGCDAL